MYLHHPLPILITLIMLFTHATTAASILRRDPSNLINTRHPTQNTNNNDNDQQHRGTTEKRTPFEKLTIQGHGVVAIPVGPSGELVDITSPGTSQNSNTDPSSIVRLVEVGDTTFQIIGNDITVTGDDDDDDDSLNGIDSQENQNTNEGGRGNLTPGQLAAMAFAKAAEEIMAEGGGKGYEIDPDSGGVRVGVGFGQSGISENENGSGEQLLGGFGR